ncbi:hypothetical protein [Streptomyces sp. 6N223]|uniref:hypothetical protein n=1 Tax=Streptomyces sp. 6N223 TaxID=3457412 RepID=UPI003FCEF72F
MNDTRNANPDQMDQLADHLCTLSEGGAYATLSSAFDRARNLDASSHLASLSPLLSWLMDTADQLRDKAALLRGDTPPPDWSYGHVPTQEELDEYARMQPGDPFEVIGQGNIDRFLEIVQQDGELTEEEIAELATLLGAFADNPNFAAALVDQMGVEEFLALSQQIQDRAGDMEDPDDANRLREDMGHVLTAAFFVPGNLKPGTQEYEDWTRNTPQGRAYAARMEAFANASDANTAEAAELVEGVINADDLSVTELNALNEFLENNAQNGDFNRALMSGISPEGLAELAERLPERISGGDEELRPGYSQLQQNIANSLANATDVGRPQPGDPWYPNWSATSEAQWYIDFMEDFHEVGRSEIDVGFSDYDVRGYQLLTQLMEAGNADYSSGFLTDVADDIRDAEEGNDDFWPTHYGDAAGVEGTDWEDLERFNLDPVNSVLGIMGRQPEAAALWLDPDRNDNLDYLINDRNWETNYKSLMTSPYSVTELPMLPDDHSGFGNALEAATTGHPAWSDEAYHRTPAGDRIMQDVVEAFSADEGALIADDGKFVDIRAQLGHSAAAFMEDIQYTLGEQANLLHAPQDDLPDLFEYEGGQGHNMVGLFISQVGRNPEAYGALTGAQQAYTALAVDVAMNGHSGSGVNVGERVENAIAPGATVAGILADARADAVFNDRIAEDEAFNQKVDIAETAAGLILGEGVGLLTERLPVGGDVISWGVEELQGSIFDSIRRDSSDEARADANDEYWAAQDAMGEAARNAIDVAGQNYVPQQPGENVDATLEDLRNGVGETINAHWDDKYHWTEPPEER